MATTSTKRVSKSLLDKETDARFWAQTHYKVGRKLDPADPTDRAMMKVWLDVFAKVKREDDAGRLVVTYNHPAVESALGDAARSQTSAEDHLDQAVTSPSQEVDAHVDRAAAASQAAATAAARAAAVQPPTVSPIVVAAAAQEAAAAAQAPPPLPVVQSLPPDHPAASSPAAMPAVPPGVTQGPVVSPGAVDPAPESIPDPTAQVANSPPPAAPPRPRTNRERLAVAQAVSAPAVAVAVHESAQGAPPATGALHPRTVAQLREVAQQLARATDGSFVGVSYSADERWSVPKFASREEAESWYGAEADHADRNRYLAVFDKTAPEWPAASEEVLGASGSGVVREHADLVVTKGSYGPIAAVGAFLGLAVAVIAANQARKRGA